MKENTNSNHITHLNIFFNRQDLACDAHALTNDVVISLSCLCVCFFVFVGVNNLLKSFCVTLYYNNVIN